MRIAAAVALNPEQRQALERMARARSMPARRVERARIVLRITPENAEAWFRLRLGTLQ